jgi:peroxiredoxin
MKKSVAWVLVSMLFLAAAALAIAEEKAAPLPLKERYTIGDEFPPISLLNLEGKEVEVASLLKANKNYIVFFNTACMNCQLEMSIFKKNYDSAKKKGIGVVAVGIDMGGPAVLMKLQKKRKYPFPVLSDKEFLLAGKLGLSFTPATVVVDKEKKIVMIDPGFDNDKATKLEAELK